MTSHPARSCAHKGCNNRTTDPSGRCHHHKGISYERASRAAEVPGVTPSSPVVEEHDAPEASVKARFVRLYSSNSMASDDEVRGMPFADLESELAHLYGDEVLEAARNDLISERTYRLAGSSDNETVTLVQKAINCRKAAWRQDPEHDDVWGLVKLDDDGNITNNALIVLYADGDFETSTDLYELEG